MKKTTFNLFQQTALSCNNALENALVDADMISRAPLYSEFLQEELENGKPLSDAGIVTLYYSLSSISSENRYSYVVLLYNANQSLVFNYVMADTAYVAREDHSLWLETAAGAKGRTQILPFDDPQSRFSCVLVKTIRDIRTLTDIGTIVLALPRSYLDATCQTVCTDYHARVLIFSDTGDTVYDTAEDPSDAIPQDVIAAAGDSRQTTTVATDDHWGVYLHQGRYSILIYSRADQLLSKVEQSSMLMQLITLVAVLIVFLLTLLLSHQLTYPLSRITALMKQIQNGDTSVRFHAKYHDEIGILGRNFNEMLDRLNELMHRLVEAESIKKQSEIDALKGQIKPHFVYNMLETFQVMAVKNNCFELAMLISSFGKIMRYNITLMNEKTTILQEMEYLEQYVSIQGYRYSNAIVFQHKIDSNFVEYPIIKLLLQPIVENAIVHGNTNKAQNFVIELHAYPKNGFFRIDISDNGAGIEAGKLTQLRYNLAGTYTDTKGSASIGLINVKERIHLYYGKDYGVYLESTPGKGTCVSLLLPEEGENECGIS